MSLTIGYPVPFELVCYVQIVFPADITLDSNLVSYAVDATGFFTADGTTVLNPNSVTVSGQTIQFKACNYDSSLPLSGTSGPSGTITFNQVHVPN
jgi:hypothetical protein